MATAVHAGAAAAPPDDPHGSFLLVMRHEARGSLRFKSGQNSFSKLLIFA
jgi:hypothetical protein